MRSYQIQERIDNSKDKPSTCSSESSYGNYHFILPTEQEKQQKKSLFNKKKSPLKGKSPDNQQKQQKNQLPELNEMTQYEALRMRAVDLEKIYPQSQKNKNGALINIFFDKDRKLQRYADGTKLIHEFVSPIYSSMKMRSLTKEQRKIQDKVIKTSYDESPENEKSQYRIKPQLLSDNYLQQYQLPLIQQQINQPFSMGSTRVTNRNQTQIHNETQSQWNQDQNSYNKIQMIEIKESSTDTLRQQQKEKQQTLPFYFGLDISQQSLSGSSHLHEEIPNNLDINLPKQYEKDYTRISMIKQNQSPSYRKNLHQNKKFRNYSNSKYDNQDIYHNMNSTGYSTLIKPRYKGRLDFRIIAPFIENHLQRLNETADDIEQVNQNNKLKLKDKKQEFNNRWKDFDQSIYNYTNTISQRQKKDANQIDPEGHFKIISLRKKFQ